jgi:hypothetical protein
MRDYRETQPLPEDLPADEQPDFVRKAHPRPVLYNETLQEILGMDSAALIPNRQGRLTDTQRQRIREALLAEMAGQSLLFNIFIGTALFLALIFVLESLNMVYLAIGAGALISAFMLWTLRRQSHLRNDLEYRVQRVEGILRLHRVADHHALSIDKVYLPITAEAFNQLSEHEMPLCRAYLSGKTGALLSLEVLQTYGDEKPKNTLSEALAELQEDEKRKNEDVAADEKPPEEHQARR